MSENTKTVLQAFAADILATEADRIRQIEMHRKAKADHDALFVTLPKLFDRCLPFVKGSHSSAREAVFKVLRSDGTPLFCRWAAWKDGRDERDWHPDDARWTPLPPCPVECFSRSRECSGGLHTAQTYTHTASPGTITTPDPLAAACGQDDGPGQFVAGALAIRREDADRLFGPAVPASAAPEPPAPVAAAPETAPSASAPAMPIPEPVASPAVTVAPKGIRRQAMLARHEHHWPNIKSDISSAAANGLAAAAKAGVRGWREAAALAWAEENGRIVSAPEPDALSSALRSLPTTRHKLAG